MTTITFEKDIVLEKTTYKTVADFLGTVDSSIIYEEYLERKLLESKKTNNFVNLYKTLESF